MSDLEKIISLEGLGTFLTKIRTLFMERSEIDAALENKTQVQIITWEETD